MTSKRTVTGKCSECDYNGEHNIVAMKTDGIGFGFGLECPKCGKLVPEQAWPKYQKTGDVVIPKLRHTSGVHNSYQKGSRNAL